MTRCIKYNSNPGNFELTTPTNQKKEKCELNLHVDYRDSTSTETLQYKTWGNSRSLLLNLFDMSVALSKLYQWSPWFLRDPNPMLRKASQKIKKNKKKKKRRNQHAEVSKDPTVYASKTHSVWPRQKLCISCAPSKGLLGSTVIWQIKSKWQKDKLIIRSNYSGHEEIKV